MPRRPKTTHNEVQEIRRQAENAVRLLRPVQDLLPRILSAVPRSKLVEQLRLGDKRAYARFFRGFRPQKIPRVKVHAFIREEIFERDNDILAHLVVVLWNTSREDVYEACKEDLQVVNPDVTKIKWVDPETSRAILERLLERFGVEDVTVVVAINEARFDRHTLEELIPDRDWSAAPQDAESATDDDEEAEAEAETAPDDEGTPTAE